MREESGEQANLPTAIAEAMAAGFPCVSTRFAGLPEMIDEGVSGRLVEPGDARALASVLQELLRDPRRARALGRAGQDRARKLFDLRNSTRALWEILGRFQSGKPAAPREGKRSRKGGPVRRRAASLGTYVICSTHRSGSSLLCQLLSDTGICGSPDEYFSPTWAPRFARELSTGVPARRRWESGREVEDPPEGVEDLDAPAYLRELFDRKATPNGVWGCKIQWRHTDVMGEMFQGRPRKGMSESARFDLLEELFSSPRYIWIQRRDKVRQAISFWRSKQTRVYTTSREPSPDHVKPEFDFAKIRGFVERFQHEEEAWEKVLERANCTPLVIAFEDFTGRLEETVLEVIEYLGIEIPDGFEPPRPRLKKLSDELNEEWYQRYQSMI